MQKKFSVYPVQNKWTAIMSGNIYETRSKFNRPTRDRRYVKILALCLMYATAGMMYPHTKHPLMHQVRDMCRYGLLQRYRRTGSRAYWYKTTAKGINVLEKALRNN